MSDHSDALGGRLPLADPTDLVGAQRELFDKMTSAVVPWADDTGFHSTTDDGRFIGPFNPALLNPAMTSLSGGLVLGEWQHTSGCWQAVRYQMTSVRTRRSQQS
jgi:4-carboxymuconolactone decarboxylase